MGILLAAEIIERITGQPLREFEEQEIFGPLGMDRSGLLTSNLPLRVMFGCIC